MDNKEFGKQLESRTKKFAIMIIKTSAKLPLTSEGKVIKNQEQVLEQITGRQIVQGANQTFPIR